MTDFHASNMFTDIHDWNYAEALGKELKWGVSEEEYLRMRR